MSVSDVVQHEQSLLLWKGSGCRGLGTRSTEFSGAWSEAGEHDVRYLCLTRGQRRKSMNLLA